MRAAVAHPAIVMRYLSLCSGIEGASVAWLPLGFTPVAFAEIDPFACAVLSHHYPGVPNLGDIRRYPEWPDAAVDLLVAGTPCPSFSVAGKRAGLDDPRGALALVLPAVARRYAARWLLWENVPGVLSSNGGRDFGTFLGQLEKLGYGFAWRILDAQFFGLAQRRRRVFVIGHLGNWRAAAAVLFERASLLGHPAPRREPRQDLAPTLAARTRGGGGLGTDSECDGGLIPELAPTLRAGGNLTGGNRPPGTDVDTLESLIPGIARALTGSNERIDAETETLLVTHTLSADGFDASEDGTGRGTPLVPVAFAQNQRSEARLMSITGALAAEPGMKQQSYVLAVRGRDDGRNLEVHDDDLANALVTPNGGRDGIGVGAMLTPSMQVRRLMPIECERLMGFPDDYTRVTYRGKPAADGPRYRVLGNSIAVPVLAWIGQRIAFVDALLN